MNIESYNKSYWKSLRGTGKKPVRILTKLSRGKLTAGKYHRKNYLKTIHYWHSGKTFKSHEYTQRKILRNKNTVHSTFTFNTDFCFRSSRQNLVLIFSIFWQFNLLFSPTLLCSIRFRSASFLYSLSLKFLRSCGWSCIYFFQLITVIFF